jgi:hypothetical protein
MPRISRPLEWDDANVGHLLHRHHVLVDEVEEVLFGLPGEEPRYLCRREGDHYVFLGETGHGRLLKRRGEFRRDKRLRVLHAMDLDDEERRDYRRRGL